MPQLSALHLYPVKGCAGISVPQVLIDARGPVGDRRLMVVDADGVFMTQRSHPRMALIRTQLSSSHLTLDAPGMSMLSVSLVPENPRRVATQVWRSQVNAVSLGTRAQTWLSEFLGTDAALVGMDEQSARTASTDYAPPDTHVSFADAYPILLVSEASLEHLNAKLSTPLPMNRFRPNLVVSGTAPHEEDTWVSIRIGDVQLDVVKPCDRCTVTTVDQLTGLSGKEPLKTLASYRRRDNKIYFGQNLVHRSLGLLRIGAEVEVLSTQTPLAVGEPTA